MINNKIFPPSFLKSLNAERDVLLARFSTLKVGGLAKFFICPKNKQEIADIDRACFEYGLPLHILSGGSNTLFSDEGFDGVVIKLDKSFDFIRCEHDGLSMIIGSATPLAKVTKIAMQQGWNIAVGLSGIPGLTGGAVFMNAGTKMGEIGDIVTQVHGILHGQEISIKSTDIQFNYRNTNLPKELILTEVELHVGQSDIGSALEIEKKVHEYRNIRRLTQPTNNSLGSFFKNPYPLYAAQLIEKCNLKGLSCNGAQVSLLHANFIINNGNASASDILYIANIIQKRVYEEYGIVLSPEVKLVGFTEEFCLSK
jgi:UDP-N-acetylmuramate dehydrogenase